MKIPIRTENGSRDGRDTGAIAVDKRSTRRVRLAPSLPVDLAQSGIHGRGVDSTRPRAAVKADTLPKMAHLAERGAVGATA